ncbi:cell differentiation family, Rcd1-like protein, partial [Reticulomyxa filosa]
NNNNNNNKSNNNENNENDFRDCKDAITKFGNILHPIWKSSLHNQISERPIAIGLNAGKPNLVISSKKLLFELLALFESQRFIPRAEHVLVCNEMTTEEDVACLIFRAITNSRKATAASSISSTSSSLSSIQHNVVQPLYCLMFPEKLTLTTLDNVCQDVYDLLLNDLRLEKLKDNLYMFAVMSSRSENNLCKSLSHFQVTLQDLSPEGICHQMLSQLYCKSWTTSPSCDLIVKPCIQLYTSDRVAMGKSTLIQRDMEKIRNLCKGVRAVKEVCVTFNGKDIDWEQTMKSLWSHHPCVDAVGLQGKHDKLKHELDALIVYHLNISSCVSEQINDFLFELLFLQHINSNFQMCQCFHVNPNMAFLIEVPSTLNDPIAILSPQKLFYLFFSVAQFPILQVTMQNNPFVFGKEAQYAIKWMQEFFAGHLKFCK